MYKAVILLLIAASSANQLPNGCPSDWHVHRLLPHETDCAKFYTCSHGQKILMECAPGTLFDAHLQTCNWPALVTCHATPTQPTSSTPGDPPTSQHTTTHPPTTQPPVACPSNVLEHQLLPHDTNCSKFYQCSNGVLALKECPDGLHFDINFKICNWPFMVTCGTGTTTVQPSSIQPSTTQPPMTQPPTTQPTTHPPMTHPPTTEVEYLPNGCPKDQHIHHLLPHEDCAKFYQCNFGSKVERDCAPGTLFDFDLQVCNHANLVKCTPGSTGSTTHEPIVTEPITHEPTTKEPATDEPTTQEPATTYEPNTGVPVTYEPSEPTTKEPSTTWEPTTKEPSATWEPTTREPSTTWEPTTREPPTTWEPTSTLAQETTTLAQETTTLAQETTTLAQETTTLAQETTTLEQETTTVAELCPLGIVGNVPHPNKCDSFYMCAGGIAIQLFCVAGFEFDPVLRTCVPIAEGGCTLGITTDGSTTEGYSTTLSSDSPTGSTDSPTGPTDSSTGSTDSPTGPTDSSTGSTDSPTGATDSPTGSTVQSVASTTLATDQPTTTDITTVGPTSSVTPPAQLCPLGVFGNVAHPSLCNSFYMCAGGNAIQLFCSNGFEFDSALSTCVEIVEGGCTLGSATTTAPTDGSTTELTTDDSTTVSNTVTTEISTDVPTTDESLVTETVSDKATTISETTTTKPDKPDGSVTTEYLSTTQSDLTTLDALTTVVDILSTTLGLSTVEDLSTVPADLTTITDFSTTPSGIETTDILSTVTDSTAEVESTTTVAQLCPVGTILLVPNPERCDGYYMCTGAMAVPLYCGEGYEFDPDEQQCVVIAEGGCTLGSSTDPTLPTTISPTTYTTEKPTEVTTEEYTVTTEYKDKHTTEYTTEDVIKTTETTLNPIETTIVTETDSESLITVDPIIVTEATTTPETNSTEIETATVTETPTFTETPVATDNPETTTEAVELTTQNLATTTEVESTTQAQLCPLGVMGNVANKERCDAYFMCAGGMAIPLFCATGFEFDPELRTCVQIAEGGCTLGSITNTEAPITTVNDLETTTANVATTNGVKSTESAQSTISEKVELTTENVATMTEIESTTQAQLCPLGIMGNVANSERCDAYYMCAGGIAIPLFCATGFEFDPELRTCVEIAEGGCTLGSSPIVDTQTTTVNNLEITTANVATTTGVESTESVESTTLEKVEFTTENVATTLEVESTTQAQLCPLGVMGNVVNSKRCDAYYLCAGGMAIPLFCATWFEFDPELKTCVEIAEGGCTLGSSTITTIKPTTGRETTIENTATTEAATTDKVEFTTENVATTKQEVETTTAAQICPIGIMGNVACPDSCSAYFMCVGGTPIPLFCGDGFEFDPISQGCISIAEGGCTLSSNTDSEEATDPTKDESSTYKENIPIETTTEVPTTVYEKITEADVPITGADPDKVETIEEVETTTKIELCPSGSMGNVANPVRCDSYYMCAGGMAIPLYCAEGFEFDPILRQCVAIAEGGCTFAQSNATAVSTLRTIPEDITSVLGLCEGEGSMADPKQCDSFYVCANGKAIRIDCDVGYEYSAAAEKCEPVSEGRCTV